MKMTRSEIELLIPQRPPFVMIDTLVEVDENAFTAELEVRSDNIFLEGDRLESYALIESIAQTTAAGLALVITDPDSKPKEGFLGSITRLIAHVEPHVGDTVVTKVKRISTFENMYKVQGECYRGSDLLLSCELKLVGIQN